MKGRPYGAKRGGDNNYSPEKGTPDLGGDKKKERHGPDSDKPVFDDTAHEEGHLG
jgi:hypothetical protein